MIVITGATGRLGQAVMSELRQTETDFRGLGRRASQDITSINYSDTDALKKAFEGATAIWHLAGGLRGKGQETPDIVNHQLTNHILDAAAQIKTKPTVLIVSSTAVYGDRSNLWVKEDMPPSPNTRYGKSKLDAEMAALNSGLPVQIVRMGTIYGPGVPFTAINTLKESNLWLPGEGRCYLPMIHIDDAALGIIHIAKKLETGQIVHLADSDPMLLSEFYDTVCKESKANFRARFWSTWLPSYLQHAIARQNERIQSRLNRRPHWTPDMLKLYTASVRVNTQKLREDLGFTLKYPSAKVGIQESIQT